MKRFIEGASIQKGRVQRFSKLSVGWAPLCARQVSCSLYLSLKMGMSSRIIALTGTYVNSFFTLNTWPFNTKKNMDS